MSEYKKPLPVINQDNQGFWDGCNRGELVIQKCSSCGTFRFYPRPMCHECSSMDFTWQKLSGKGKVYDFAIVRKYTRPEFNDQLPYAIIIVEPEDAPGIRIPSNIVECKPDDLRIDMPVEVVFERVTPEIALPKFKPISITKR